MTRTAGAGRAPALGLRNFCGIDMGTMTRIAVISGLAVLGHWSPAALGGHPVLTEDTGTQGAGRYQLELSYDSNHRRAAAFKSRDQNVNAVLSIGMLENLDLAVALPYDRLTERRNGMSATTGGFADMEISVKWRFYEDEALSFALRPGLGLPTADEDKGLGTGSFIPSLFAVMTYSSGPWSCSAHLGHTRNFHDGPEERRHIYHASVSAEHGVSNALRLVADASIESNAERSGHPPSSVMLGLVYAVTPAVDVDLGYRKGLTEAAPDHAFLAGMAMRF